MTQEIVIQLRIIIPDSAKVPMPEVDYQDEPEHVAPLPPQALYDPAEMVQPVQASTPACNAHGPMKRYPAGTNKVGKPYNASWRCAVKDCATKPIWDKDAA